MAEEWRNPRPIVAFDQGKPVLRFESVLAATKAGFGNHGVYCALTKRGKTNPGIYRGLHWYYEDGEPARSVTREIVATKNGKVRRRFKSVAAARRAGFNNSAIYRALHNKNHNGSKFKTYKGFIWQYAE